MQRSLTFCKQPLFVRSKPWQSRQRPYHLDKVFSTSHRSPVCPSPDNTPEVFPYISFILNACVLLRPLPHNVTVSLFSPLLSSRFGGGHQHWDHCRDNVRHWHAGLGVHAAEEVSTDGGSHPGINGGQ